MALGRLQPPRRVGLLQLLILVLMVMGAVPACTGGSSAGGSASPPRTSNEEPPGAGASSSGTGAADQPVSPIRAAFYYQWFPEGWRQDGVFPYTVYRPSLGFYDSGAAATIRSHVDAMRYGNVTAAITSWWGPNQKSEQLRVPALLAGAADVDADFRIALYYEQEGIENPSVAELKRDLDYIWTKYAHRKNYLGIGRRPVLFVYAADDTDCSVIDRWKTANEAYNFYLDMKVFPGWSSCPRQPDGWHQYAPAQSSSEVSTDLTIAGAFSISPGFAHAGGNGLPARPEPHLERDLNRWSQAIRGMVASKQPWQLITTFNEWGEGTSVESAIQWATRSGHGAYLDALHNNGR